MQMGVQILCLSLLAIIYMGGCSGQDQAQDIFYRAEEYLAAGKVNDARLHYERYLQEEPGGAKAWSAWSRLLTIRVDMEGDLPAGVNILHAMQLEFHAHQDRLWEINSRLADLYYRLGKPEESLRIWKSHLELADSLEQEMQARISMARIMITLRDFHGARQAMQDAPPCLPEKHSELCTTILYLWGKAYYLDNQSRQAESKLAQAYILETDNETRCRAGMLLAEVLLELDEIVRARELLQELKKFHPNPAAVKARLDAICVDELPKSLQLAPEEP